MKPPEPLHLSQAEPAADVRASLESPPALPERVVSVDALRGFDMFWIIGGALIIRAFKAFPEWPAATFLAAQMEHVKWEGFHFEDLIFPLFIFISGTSLVFSVTRQITERGRGAATTRIVIRAVFLFLLGVIYNGGIARGMDNIRWMGVLQRIAIAYLGAGLLFVWLRPRTLVIACLTLLLGYWALLAWVPVPGSGPGNYAEGSNLTNYLDRLYLPGRKHDGDHDPEGLLSSLPAIATCLFGIFSGLWLRGSSTPLRKVAGLIIAGAVLLAVGWTWAGWFPVIKKLWTSSFVLVAGGWSALLLALFYYLIDVRGWRRGFQPWIWIGMNPITLYFLASIVSFGNLAERLVGGEIKTSLNTAVHPGTGDLLVALVACTLVIGLAGFLYRKRIFLRV